jgi:hypothetical protein
MARPLVKYYFKPFMRSTLDYLDDNLKKTCNPTIETGVEPKDFKNAFLVLEEELIKLGGKANTWIVALYLKKGELP